MAQLRSEITVTVDDKDAQQALNELLQKLDRAQKLAERPGKGSPTRCTRESQRSPTRPASR